MQTTTDKTMTVATVAIRRSPFNPREIDPKTLDPQFVDSIRQKGIIQPLIVRTTIANPPLPIGYELVAGERRWCAAKVLKLEAVPVIVRQLSDTEAMELQAIENLQRADLSPVEEATNYQQLVEKYKGEGLNVEKAVERLGARVGKAKATIYQALRLLKLPEPVRQAVSAGKLPPSHAAEIAKLEKFPEAQVEAMRLVLKPDEDDDIYEEDLDGGILSFRATKRRVEDLQREATRKEKFDAHAKKSGMRLLPEEERKKAFRHGYLDSDVYVTSSDWCSAADGRYGSLMGKKAPKAWLTHDERWEPVQVYLKSEALEAIKANGKKLDGAARSVSRGSKEANRARAAAAATRRKTAIRRAVVSAVIEKAGKLDTAPASLQFAKFILQAMNARALSDTIREMFNRRGLDRKDYKSSGYTGSPHHTWFKREIEAVTHTPQAVALIVDLAIAMDLSGWGGTERGDKLLTSACAIFGVNPKKIAPAEKAKPPQKAKPQASGVKKEKDETPAAFAKRLKEQMRKRLPAPPPLKFSAEGRQKLSALMKARWNARRKGGPQKKSLSAASRARIATAARARWASVKKKGAAK